MQTQLNAYETSGSSPGDRPRWRKCGHPRTPENTKSVSAKHPAGRCKMCCLAWNKTEKGRASARRSQVRRTRKGGGRERRPGAWRKCDHPRTPENTVRVANAPGGRCRMCQRAAARRHYGWYSRTGAGRAAARAKCRRLSLARAAARAAKAAIWKRCGHQRTSENTEAAGGCRTCSCAHRWRQQGITDLSWERFLATVADQGGRCAICRGLQDDTRKTRLDADHDHRTGRFRAALCASCNISLANYENSKRISPEQAKKFQTYLAAFAA